jgi:2-C-methyl-D-erythritol 4-phosphate cytidylyltransferase
MTAAATATAVIAAAGSGERLGADRPKALVELGDRPLLAWSLEAFAKAESVAAVVVAAPPGREAEVAEAVAAQLGEGPAVTVVTGGETRSESVAAATQHARGELIAIHDAARPLVTAALIDELVARLESRPDAAGVIAAAPLTDTIKRAREPRPPGGELPSGGPAIAKTESRDHLWAAQTPQVFRAGALRDALAADPQRLATATDEAMLVERAGGVVLLHTGPRENLKVTGPMDLAVAEALLKQRSYRRTSTHTSASANAI